MSINQIAGLSYVVDTQIHISSAVPIYMRYMFYTSDIETRTPGTYSIENRTSPASDANTKFTYLLDRWPNL